ncbi:hypothetical protein ACHAXS_012728, partial [Conticribra weissflogii]
PNVSQLQISVEIEFSVVGTASIELIGSILEPSLNDSHESECLSSTPLSSTNRRTNLRPPSPTAFL